MKRFDSVLLSAAVALLAGCASAPPELDPSLEPFTPLKVGSRSVLAEELREPAVYNTILCTMAAGNNKLNDMYHCTGFSRAKISVYLKNLMEIDLVEKTGAGIYRIAKSHIRFYFYFIFPHLSFLESIAPAQFYELFVADAFQEFLRETYREI